MRKKFKDLQGLIFKKFEENNKNYLTGRYNLEQKSINKHSKYLPNIITLSRILLTIVSTVYIYYYFGKLFIPLFMSLLIFLSDYLDGYIARCSGNRSWFGNIFDILGDLFYIVLTYMVLSIFKVLPFWFLIVIILKFKEFSITSYMLKKPDNSKFLFVFDFIGRMTAVLFYIIPIFSYAMVILFPVLYYSTINTVIRIITVLAVISSSYRIINIIKNYYYLKEQS